MNFYMKSVVALGAVVALPAMLSAPAFAAACSVSNVDLVIGSTTYNPSSCGTGLNQGSPSGEASSMNADFGTSFTAFAKDDGTTATLDGIKFTITAADGSTSGSWTVAWQDTNGSASLNLPIQVDFILGLFGGNNGDGYEFQDVILPSSPTSGTGSFDIVFLNNGGQTPGLSHIDLLVGDPEEAPTPVPEPATLAVLGAALIGFGALRRRKT